MLLATVTQKYYFFIRIKIIFCNSQLFSTNHSFFQEIATNFYNIALFSTVSQLFSLQITTFFYNVGTFFYNLATFFHKPQLSSTTFFYKYCNLIFQRYRNSIITTRLTKKLNPTPGILNENQSLVGGSGGPNQLSKSQDSKYWKRDPTSSILWV